MLSIFAETDDLRDAVLNHPDRIHSNFNKWQQSMIAETYRDSYTEFVLAAQRCGNKRFEYDIGNIHVVFMNDNNGYQNQDFPFMYHRYIELFTECDEWHMNNDFHDHIRECLTWLNGIQIVDVPQEVRSYVLTHEFRELVVEIHEALYGLPEPGHGKSMNSKLKRYIYANSINFVNTLDDHLESGVYNPDIDQVEYPTWDPNDGHFHKIEKCVYKFSVVSSRFINDEISMSEYEHEINTLIGTIERYDSAYRYDVDEKHINDCCTPAGIYEGMINTLQSIRGIIEFINI